MRARRAERRALALSLLSSVSAMRFGFYGSTTTVSVLRPLLCVKSNATTAPEDEAHGCVPLLDDAGARSFGGGSSAARWSECGCAAASAACAGRNASCVVRHCDTDTLPAHQCALQLCRMGAHCSSTAAALPSRAVASPPPLLRRAALDASSAGTRAVTLLASLAAAQDALFPAGWRLPGPPWCCGACCGDIGCFPCYALPFDYVAQRVALLATASAGAPQPPPAPLQLIYDALGAPLNLLTTLGPVADAASALLSPPADATAGISAAAQLLAAHG